MVWLEGWMAKSWGGGCWMNLIAVKDFMQKWKYAMLLSFVKPDSPQMILRFKEKIRKANNNVVNKKYKRALGYE